MAKNVKICQKKSNYVKKCQNFQKSQIMSKNVKICQKCQNIIQKILKSLKKKNVINFILIN